MSDGVEAIQESLAEIKKKEKKRGRKFVNVDVVESADKQIAIPEGMSYKEAAKWLERREEEMNQEVSIRLEFDAFPSEGALALSATLKDIFGWTSFTPGGFFKAPPATIVIDSDYNETTTVIWGEIEIPNVAGAIGMHASADGLRPKFIVSGWTLKKHEALFQAIGEQVKIRLKTDSLYHGKAIRLNLRDEDGDRIDMRSEMTLPKFIDLDSINAEDLVLPSSVEGTLQSCLWSPIRNTELCELNGAPLKRGIMLEGPYGTGKTMVAWVTAKMCVENGWTFLYIEDVRDLDVALEIATMYEPCVVFAEDVDRAIGAGRDSETDRFLNTIDGITSKGSRIITVLTTNEVDAIHKSFVRPGRIDTVATVSPPDCEAAARLILGYGRGLIDATQKEIEVVVEPLVERGATAALYREVTERSKLSAINRGSVDDKGYVRLKATDIDVACQTMSDHLDLLNREPPQAVTGLHQLGAALGANLAEPIAQRVEDYLAVAARSLQEDGVFDGLSKRITSG